MHQKFQWCEPHWNHQDDLWDTSCWLQWLETTPHNHCCHSRSSEQISQEDPYNETMLAWLFLLGKCPGFAQLMSKEYFPSAKSEFAGTKEIKSVAFFLMLWQLCQDLFMRIFAPLHIELALNTMQYKYVGMIMSHTEETHQAIVFYTKWKFYQKIVQHNICHILVCFPVDDLSG